MQSLVRHITPVSPDRATGVVAEVYAQVNAEYSNIGPAVMMMSPSPELLAAGWSLMREAQLAGEVPALEKAVVTLGVAQVNEMDFEIQAFLGVLRLLGQKELADTVEGGGRPADPALAALLRWAVATGGDPVAAPFGGDAVAEYVGTTLFRHFIDRMAAVMLPAGLTPGSMVAGDEPPFEGAPVLRDLDQDLRPGVTLPLLDGLPAGEEPGWAAGRPIGTAYAALVATAAQGAGLLSPAAAQVAAGTIAEHRGRRRPAGDWLEESLSPLAEHERAGAKVAILAGLAPEEATGELVAAWRATDRRFSDHCTVYLLAYGAMAAVTHIEAGLTATLPR
ncbi:hypothetical protein AB0I81_24805 [Nonomuraea sp. NPDC050404]|uniref:hypothetical protein n=1 Tax=Nonomuraea sp. NPDC050404 TaxID=3155783 RepID=UPI0033C5DD2A